MFHDRIFFSRLGKGIQRIFCHESSGSYTLGCEKTGSNKGKLRFTIYMQGSPNEHAIILVVTVTRRGKHPKIQCIMVGIPDSQRKIKLSNCPKQLFSIGTTFIHSKPPRNKHIRITPKMFLACEDGRNIVSWDPIEIIFHQPGSSAIFEGPNPSRF